MNDNGANDILKFAAGGGMSVFATGLDPLIGIAVDRSGNVFVDNSSPNGLSSEITKFSPTGAKTIFDANSPGINGLAFDTSGNLYVLNLDPNLYQISPSGSESTFATGLGLADYVTDASYSVFVPEPTPTRATRAWFSRHHHVATGPAVEFKAAVRNLNRFERRISGHSNILRKKPHRIPIRRRHREIRQRILINNRTHHNSLIRNLYPIRHQRLRPTIHPEKWIDAG